MEPTNFSFSRFPKSVLTEINEKLFKLPDLLNASRKFPKSWQWRIYYKTKDNQEGYLSSTLCDANKQPITYSQNLDHFFKFTGQSLDTHLPIPFTIPPPRNAQGYLLGYNLYQCLAVYINTVSFNNELFSYALEHKYDYKIYTEINYARDNIKFTYDLFHLKNWNYRTQTFTMNLEENSWITFRFNLNGSVFLYPKSKLLQNGFVTSFFSQTDWIPITIIG